MSCRLALFSIAFLLSIGLTGQAPRVPNPGRTDRASEAPDNGPRVAVSGSVVNSVTSEPIPRAMVQLFARGARATLTGPDGRFQFQDVPAGSATVTAQKPGFFSLQELNLSDAGSPYVILQIAQDPLSNITVKLLPSATISGRVIDVNGEPIESVQVRALVKRIDTGSARWEERSNATTDEAGEYRFANLMPGDYYIGTIAKPVSEFSATAREAGATSDRFFPSTFFPGSSTLSSASPLSVGAGQEANADFRLSITGTYRVSGTVAGMRPGPTSFVLLDADGTVAGLPARFDRRTNHFGFTGVLPGSYSVFVNSHNGGQALFGTAAVTVGNADLGNVQVTIQPAASIPVHIALEGVNNNAPEATPNVSVHLRPREPNIFNMGAWSHSGDVNGTAALSIPGVMPGRYKADVQISGDLYVSSLRSGASDLSRDDLIVPPGPEAPPLDLVIRSGAASIHGTLKDNETPVRGWVVLLPDDESTSAPVAMAVTGAFTINGIAPGSYHVYGFPSVKTLEYCNRELMRSFESAATSISVGERDQKEISVPLISGSHT